MKTPTDASLRAFLQFIRNSFFYTDNPGELCLRN